MRTTGSSYISKLYSRRARRERLKKEASESLKGHKNGLSIAECKCPSCTKYRNENIKEG